MIEALLLYLISIMISLLIDYKNYYQVLYEINKRGNYVVNNLYDVAFKTSYGTSVIERLIPIYNIIKPLFIGLNINETFDKFYDILDKANVLEMMEPEKRRELLEKPTLAKAKELTNKHEKQLDNYSKMVFNDYSFIVFDANDDSIMKIKRVMGPLAKEDGLTKFKKLEHGIELYKAFVETAYSKVLTKEEMEGLLKEQYTFDLSKIDDTQTAEEFKKHMLESLDQYPEDKQAEKDAKAIRRILKK